MLGDGGIDVLIDVGANNGAWAAAARDAGFAGRIESFEPQSGPYDELVQRAATDTSWTSHKLALSDHSGTETLHISPEAMASSLLPLGLQAELEPGHVYTESEFVQTARLDDLRVAKQGESVYLKVDVQGHELAVLHGARETIEKHCAAVELELSFVPLYSGQALAHDLMAWMAERAFRLASIEISWRDRRTGDLLLANGIFTAS
jgi:FkbM family methyltransferase